MPVSEKQKQLYGKLLADLRRMERVLVAFSGGMDSALLLQAAQKALGDAVLAVTFVTPYSPKAETARAVGLAKALQVPHRVVPLLIPDEIRNNPPDRCYLCKRNFFGRLFRIAEKESIKCVLDGTNVDDLGDYRPGRKAAKELGVLSPLLLAGMAKPDIRELLREEGLAAWDKPAGGCLLTRLPHGAIVVEESLDRIDEGEEFLRSVGFPAVRLRHHGDLARIELPPEAMDVCLPSVLRSRIIDRLKELGYRHVALDLAGYRVGSLNEAGVGFGSDGLCSDAS
jgi:uncharacterized protein